MPEIIEVEMYRRAAAAVVGRTIAKVDAPDAWFCKGTTPLEVKAALAGLEVAAVRRRGKLMLLDVIDGSTLGIRFGMTGRLVVDGVSPIAALEYGAKRSDPKWDRFGLKFNDGSGFVISDPRRLGGVELDPDEKNLGPDAFSVTKAQLAKLLSGTEVAVKARLLDQQRLAGIGNLLADEILWRSGLDPARPASSLSPKDIGALHRSLERVLPELTERGGSHTGDLQSQRNRLGVCPKDGTSLQRRTVGGRTTYSCPKHQV
jgi:formamidopyrimidine-DNA glycosylase